MGIIIKNISNRATWYKVRRIRHPFLVIDDRTIVVRIGDKSLSPGQIRKVGLSEDDPRIQDLVSLGVIQIISVDTTPMPTPVVDTGTTPSIADTTSDQPDTGIKDTREILEGKSMAELRRILKNLGGKVERNDKKADLIGKIQDLLE